MTRSLLRLNAALCSTASWTLWLLKGGHDRGSYLTSPGSARRLRDHAALLRRIADDLP